MILERFEIYAGFIFFLFFIYLSLFIFTVDNKDNNK